MASSENNSTRFLSTIAREKINKYYKQISLWRLYATPRPHAPARPPRGPPCGAVRPQAVRAWFRARLRWVGLGRRGGVGRVGLHELGVAQLAQAAPAAASGSSSSSRSGNATSSDRSIRIRNSEPLALFMTEMIIIITTTTTTTNINTTDINTTINTTTMTKNRETLTHAATSTTNADCPSRAGVADP
jgi:hypothetical protein